MRGLIFFTMKAVIVLALIFIGILMIPPLLLSSGTPSTQSLVAYPDTTNYIAVDMSHENVKRDIKQVCSVRYPADFNMRAACGRNAEAGFNDFVTIWNGHHGNAAFQRALQGCYSQYMYGGFVDWQMAGACSRNQRAGLAEVSR